MSKLLKKGFTKSEASGGGKKGDDFMPEIPKFCTIHQMVDLKSEIEGKIRRMSPDLSHRFLYRVIAFSLSGTCLVDMPCDVEHPDCTKEA